MSHLVLVGDGILANRAHTGAQPDSATVLRELLVGWKVSLLAAEGATIPLAATQLQRVPSDANVLVLSAGGNDAMEHVELLQTPARSSGEVLDALVQMARTFGAQYRALAEAARSRVPRAVLCTIYEPPLLGKETASRATVLLSLLNDQIMRAAYGLGLDAIDLRAVCSSPGDFTLQIEPSGTGAAKIARAIASAVTSRESRGVTGIGAPKSRTPPPPASRS